MQDRVRVILGVDALVGLGSSGAVDLSTFGISRCV